MSSLEINKVIAAILTAGIVAMASGFIAEVLMHKVELTENAYPVVVAEGEGGEGAAPAKPAVEPVLPLLAAADPASGEKIAQKCAACHTFNQGEPAKIGPNLWNVVGSQIASAEGFSYSSALQEHANEKWTYEHLNRFIHDPKQFAAGTKMTFPGVDKVEDRADVIAYLRSLSDKPAPLPTKEEIAAAQQEMKAAEAQAAGGVQQAGGGQPIGPLIAKAEVEDGEKVAGKCKACHSFEQGGPNKIGPNLHNIVGQPIASDEEFSYSSALQEKSGQKWTYENLSAFLTDPQGWASGTKMTFPGVSDVEDRAAVIAYLRSVTENPPPLPSGKEAGGATPGGAQEGGAAGGAQQAAATGQSIGPLIAKAEVETGEKVAGKCKACHSFEQGGPNKIGPNLHNIVGQPIAGDEEFPYSSALEEKSGQKWTYENLSDFLTNPQGWASGTKMTFPGVSDVEDRAAVIAYLRSVTDNPPPLPK